MNKIGWCDSWAIGTKRPETPGEGVFPYMSYYNRAAHPHQEFLGVPAGLKRVKHTNKHKKILKVNLKRKI